MTSLNAQALIDEWNNGMNLVDILEILLPQVAHTYTTVYLVHVLRSSKDKHQGFVD